MKKITTIAVLLAAATFAFGQVAGEYFAPIGWGNQPSDVNWADNPHNESHVVIPMANANMDGAVDIGAMTAEDVVAIWDRIGDPNLIAGKDGGAGELADPFDLDDTGEGTFGAMWKAFYDSDALYVIFKYVDTDGISTDRWFELAIQTKEYERYEAGWQAASQEDTAGFGFRHMNDQYGRFRELGGMKLKWDQTEAIVENATSVGATAGWGGGIGGTAVGDVALIKEADGTWWYLLELAFDDLMFYDDEWGADEATNYVAMDPAVQTIISFEPSARATITDLEYSGWWNGVNDGYKMVYYAGNVEFGTDVFNPVGIGYKEDVAEAQAYIYNDMLRLKGFENPVDLEVYSIIGQRVLTAENVSNELNVSELNNGVYIIKIKGTQEAFKVLK
ncbi:MAG: T9SS type A sorting domain-containing protein [Bacteroidales bacterium]|nr:T9SS type A sorting domain-containing protein [Bacteroidales bacterium]